MRAGRYRTAATIPANLLAARPYEIRISAAIHNLRELVPAPIRINVDVQASGIVNRAYPGYISPGALAPLIEWESSHVS